MSNKILDPALAYNNFMKIKISPYFISIIALNLLIIGSACSPNNEDTESPRLERQESSEGESENRSENQENRSNQNDDDDNESRQQGKDDDDDDDEGSNKDKDKAND